MFLSPSLPRSREEANASPALMSVAALGCRQWLGALRGAARADRFRFPGSRALSTGASDASESTMSTALESMRVDDLADSAAAQLIALHSTVSADGALFGWWGSLTLAAVAVRAASLPLVYYHQVHAGRAALASRDMARVGSFVKQSPGSLWQKYMTFRRLRRVALWSAGTTPLRQTRWHMFVHLPLVLSASAGVRRIARDAPEDWTAGGLGWFSDLSCADPTGALPVINTALWLWNIDPRSSPTPGGKAKDAAKREDGSDTAAATGRDAAVDVMTRRSPRNDWATTGLQGLTLLSFPYIQSLPAGMFVFWIANGVLTATQRAILQSTSARRQLGLITAADIESSTGPGMLRATGSAVGAVRRQLEHVQHSVVSAFATRRVDESLVADVNRALQRERWNGRVTLDLEAVMRRDDETGKRYLAVVRKGAAEE